MVRNAFAGIQVCVCVLIFNAVIKLLKKAVTDNITAFLFALVLAGGVVLNLSPVWFVIFSAFIGIGLKTLEASDAFKTFKTFQSRRGDDFKTDLKANQDANQAQQENNQEKNQENQMGQAERENQENQAEEKQENNNNQENAAENENQETGDAV